MEIISSILRGWDKMVKTQEVRWRLINRPRAIRNQKEESASGKRKPAGLKPEATPPCYSAPGNQTVSCLRDERRLKPEVKPQKAGGTR